MGHRPLRTYAGSCHCGTVRFAIETDFPELTTCDCSICRRKNALMVKVHESRFTLLAGGDALTEYQFHTRTARPLLLQGLWHLPVPSQARHAGSPRYQRLLPGGVRPDRHSDPPDRWGGHGVSASAPHRRTP